MSEEFHTTHFQVFIEDHLGLNLREIDHVPVGATTRWGTYEGLTMQDDEFFYAFQPDMSDDNDENRILISTTAQVDPSAILEPGVHINGHAVVDEDEYVPAQSTVYEPADVDPVLEALVEEEAAVDIIAPFMDRMTLDSLQRIYGMKPESRQDDEVNNSTIEQTPPSNSPSTPREPRHFSTNYERPQKEYRRVA